MTTRDTCTVSSGRTSPLFCDNAPETVSIGEVPAVGVFVTQDVPREPLPVHEENFPERKRRAIAAAKRLSDDDLADTDTAVLVRAILDRHAAARIVSRFDLRWHNQAPRSHADLSDADEMRLELHVPIEGAGMALSSVPDRLFNSAGNQGHPPANTSFPPWHVTLNLSVDGDDDEVWTSFENGLGKTWSAWEEALRAGIAVANERIDEHRKNVEAAISPIVSKRRKRVVALRSASENLSIPLRPSPDRSVAIPLKPQLLTLPQVEQARAAGAPEDRLADDIANSLISLIRSFGLALERLPGTADKFLTEDEETIRDLLLFLLNANYEGTATGETFVGDGKTDILLRWRDRDAFIAECKIWRGRQQLSDAIDQLLRYTVWRDTRVALVLFIRDRADVSAAIDKAIACVRGHPQCLGEKPRDDPGSPLEFELASLTDSRKAIRLTLLPMATPSRA